MKKRSKKEVLPRWKKKVKGFNESKFSWLELFVKKSIPWIVLLLLFIILGELSGGINWLIHKLFETEWHFLEIISEFMHHYHSQIIIIDQIIISFFVIDLYFNYFKAATFKIFVKKNVFDIIAVLPLGILFRGSKLAGLIEVAELGDDIALGQEVTHVTAEAEKSAKAIAEAEKSLKFSKVSKMISRIPRFFRLRRLKDLKK